MPWYYLLYIYKKRQRRKVLVRERPETRRLNLMDNDLAIRRVQFFIALMLVLFLIGLPIALLT